MYCMSVLTDRDQDGHDYAKYISEHIRSLYPKCGIIWCSDLDFSLHAFRLRVEYFFMKPVEHEKIQEGLKAWLERIGKV